MYHSQGNTLPTASRRTTRSERTCVSCGVKESPSSLIRFAVSQEGCLVPDLKRHLGGRGAHVCASRGCIENALGKRLFNRALKRELKYQQKDFIIKTLVDSSMRQLDTLVRSAALAGCVEVGVELSLKAMREGRSQAVLVAKDSAKRNETAQRAKEASIPVIELETKKELGGLLDRKDTGVASINDINLAKALANVSRRLEDLAP